ncbi:MAG TPA: leucyl/phenylalanyl-tRNA--protein transferase [Stellaceae bacterium]|nr:leucyl/phenylalanyl-tRNA--protein transferase [Stellaceae bacterium]
MTALTPDLLLRAYAVGIFPMADSADDDEIFWVDPDRRGIIPLQGFHLSRRFRRTLRSTPFEIRCDTAFTEVIRGCASPTADRPKTWINDEIMALYTALFERGEAHSVETWYEGELVGGLYGVSLNGAFFGESMFSLATDASKIALAHLVARLILGGYALLDTQFVTDHLRQFGAMEIPRGEYRHRLARALQIPARFQPDLPGNVVSVLQSSTQTS